jgi:hypothetical protein
VAFTVATSGSRLLNRIPGAGMDRPSLSVAETASLTLSPMAGK